MIPSTYPYLHRPAPLGTGVAWYGSRGEFDPMVNTAFIIGASKAGHVYYTSNSVDFNTKVVLKGGT